MHYENVIADFRKSIFSLFKNPFNLLRKLLQLLGVLIGGYIILSIPLTLIFFLIATLAPSFSVSHIEVFGLIILILIAMFTVLYYLNSRLRKIFKPLLIITLPIWLLTIPVSRTFLFQPLIFEGNELEPYIKNGQYIILQKVDKTIERGDIIAFKSPEGKVFLGMVFALPGEKVAVENGILYINDKPFKEIQYNWDNCFINSGFIIPEGYFLYGSTNINCFFPQFGISRWIMPKSQIIGKLIFKF